MADIPVKVCLRCRPLIPKEINDGCQLCLNFTSNESQVILGKDKAFTYDSAYSPETPQTEVYANSVAPMIESLFKGYNVTVIAYGQTGSGKTYTMGTSHSPFADEGQMGIIPRAMKDLFAGVKEQEEKYNFIAKASFLEIYKEEIHDLLRLTSERHKDAVAIRENYNGNLKIVGLTEEVVSSPEDALAILCQGSLARTTGATAMNAQSSRSHAIFTISIEQTEKSDTTNSTQSKFHLVDLAGSEKANRTQAQGERFKEGVNINKGLLALGNVINALCDKNNHIPYRDSKLTRLLQDSLGGNSHTLMIACVSPADYNFEETLNTLRYADRARKIKNKPIVNRDSQAMEIMRLKQLVEQMRGQLMQGGILNLNASPIASSSCEDDLAKDQRIKALETNNEKLTGELQVAVDQTTDLCEKVLLLEMARDKLKESLKDLKSKTSVTVDAIQKFALETDSAEAQDKLHMLQGVQNTILQLQEEQNANLTTVLDDELADSPEDNDYITNLNLSADGDRLGHTLRQAEMQKQLQILNEALNKKEELAEKMSQNSNEFASMKNQYEEALKAMENEILVLQKERDEYSLNLKTAKANPVANKLSEQRRKRLLELESKISDLKKKIMEQGKMLKMKEQVEAKVTLLTNDIQSMKQQRVKLMKQMKEETKQFNKWKSEKEREVAKLKQQDRKRQVEMVKMEKVHSKQQNVLKRKIEEAVHHNKRLKQAMERRKLVSEERAKKQSTEGLKGRIEQWLNQELELVVAKKESHHHLSNLIESRKFLSRQLAYVTSEMDSQEPSSKFKRSSAEKSDNKKIPTENDHFRRSSELKDEIQLRTQQISELQQEVLEAENEENSSKRWDGVQTMLESKCALKWLFNHLAQTKFNIFEIGTKQSEVQITLEDAQKKVDALTKESQREKERHEAEIINLQREHEEKVFYLLRQLPTNVDSSAICDSSIQEKIKFQDAEISRLGSLYDEYLKISKENEGLRKKLNIITIKGGKSMKLMPDLSQTISLSEASISVDSKPKEKKIAKRTEYLSDAFDEDDGDIAPGSDDDPDWKYTPFEKRKLKRINGVGCSCKTGCKIRCSCRKADGFCKPSCKCNPLICTNQSVSENEGDTSFENAPKPSQQEHGNHSGVLCEDNERLPRKTSAPNKIKDPVPITQLDGTSDEIDSSGIYNLKLGSIKKNKTNFFNSLI